MADRCKRTLKNYDKTISVDENWPINFLEPGDQVRAGFVKGTLKKATFELNSGASIIYEQIEESSPTNLGCATTRELVEEIKARVQVHGNEFWASFEPALDMILDSPEADELLKYRTVDS